MAESMVGLKRSHRCTEVTSARSARSNRYGLGSEEQKQRRNYFR